MILQKGQSSIGIIDVMIMQKVIKQQPLYLLLEGEKSKDKEKGATSSGSENNNRQKKLAEHMKPLHSIHP